MGMIITFGIRTHPIQTKTFLRFGSIGAKQAFVQTIDKPVPPAENQYNNDFWLLVNARFDGTNWNRVDTTKPAFGFNMRAMTDIPFETGTKGVCLWVAQPGTNPIGAFGAPDGWRAAWIATEFRDFVVGGFGIEIDGNGITPYGRLVHSKEPNPSTARWTGILMNVFVDFSGRDATTKESWFAGFVDDSFKIRRAPSGATLTWQDLAHIDSAGNVGIGAKDKLSKLTIVAKPSFAISGTVAKTAASSILTGTNTKFLSDVGIGDRISVPGTITETKTVIAIASNTSLTVDSNFSYTASGQTATVLPSILRAENSSNAVQLMISDQGNVGIGNRTPLTKLHVQGTLRVEDPIYSGRSISMYTSAANFLEGTNDFYIKAGPTGGMSFWTGSLQRIGILSGGNVGIGVANPSNILTIQQNSSTDPIADAWTTYSSRRWKTNIKPIEGSLEKVKKLNGVTYDVKETGKHNLGLIAEDVGEVIPEVVNYEENGMDAKSIDYPRLVAVLIEAIKEQQKEIDDLKLNLKIVS